MHDDDVVLPVVTSLEQLFADATVEGDKIEVPRWLCIGRSLMTAGALG